MSVSPVFFSLTLFSCFTIRKVFFKVEEKFRRWVMESESCNNLGLTNHFTKKQKLFVLSAKKKGTDISPFLIISTQSLSHLKNDGNNEELKSQAWLKLFQNVSHTCLFPFFIKWNYTPNTEFHVVTTSIRRCDSREKKQKDGAVRRFPSASLTPSRQAARYVFVLDGFWSRQLLSQPCRIVVVFDGRVAGPQCSWIKFVSFKDMNTVRTTTNSPSQSSFIKRLPTYLNYIHDPYAIKEDTFWLFVWFKENTKRGGQNTNCLINDSLHEIMTKPRYPLFFCNSQKEAGVGVAAQNESMLQPLFTNRHHVGREGNKEKRGQGRTGVGGRGTKRWQWNEDRIERAFFFFNERLKRLKW